MFAFGLTNPAMLAWLAAAALPVLVHLWSRRRYREVPWAAMQYLLAAVKRRRRRLLLEQWLLLALRMAVIVLVVLAVAEPFLRRSALGVSSPGRVHRLVILDTSYSMTFRTGDQTRLDEAKQIAAQLAADSAQGDALTLVAMAVPPRTLVATPSFDARQFAAEVAQVQAAHTSADLPATLRAAEQLIQSVRRQQPRLAAHEVYFLSDLGRVGWDAGAKADEVRHLAGRLAQSAAIHLVNVGQPAAENAAVTGLRLVEALPIIGRTLHFEVRLKNFGRAAQTHRRVELLLDGRRAQEKHVDLPPGQETIVQFADLFEAPGDHAVEARLEPDRLDLDNHRYLALDVRESVRVLCINGRPSGAPLGGSADFLRLALAPSDGALTAVRPDVAAESALLERDLAQYQAVFLANVAQFTPAEARVLEGYLAGGGNLVVFLGDRVLPESYNRQLTAGEGGRPILPARIGPLESRVQLRLDPLDYRHPMLAAFRGRHSAGLITTPVMKHFRLQRPDDSRARVALGLPSGDPLVVEGPAGRGRVVLVATSADPSWSGLPASPAFVPLVQEMLGDLLRRQASEQNVEVGRALEGTLPAAALDEPFSIQPPQGPRQSVPLRLEGDRAGWTFTDTALSGIYTTSQGAGRSGAFAVNLDTVESDLEAISLDELRRQWGLATLDASSPTALEARSSDERAPGVSPGMRGLFAQPLHLLLLYAALAAMLAETVLAWRWGHHDS